MSDPLDEVLKYVEKATAYPPNSRYHGAEKAVFELPGGRKVNYLRRRAMPRVGTPPAAYVHRLVEGERLDLLAAVQLGDPALWWRIADANNLLHPDEAEEEAGQPVKIPGPGEGYAA